MKPIKLSMQAFGTFTGETVIDFKELNNKVFLIYGKTGSGKTTIFDAICYALYGAVTGDLRNKDTNQNIRSTNADNHTPTYVDFEFEIRNVRYRIYRTPGNQDIYKRKSEFGSSRAFLYQKETLVPNLKSANDVTKYITDNIMKLTRDQFKQTMMISQGDFAALIKADSNSRTQIFRSILNTYHIEGYAQALKKKSLELSSACQTSKTALCADISHLSKELFSEEDYSHKVMNENNYAITEEILETVSKALKDKQEIEKAKREEKSFLEAKRNDLNQALGKAETNNKNLRSYEATLERRNILLKEQEGMQELKKRLELSTYAKEILTKASIYEKDSFAFDHNIEMIQKKTDDKKVLESKEAQIKEDIAKLPGLETKKDGITKELTELEALMDKFLPLEKAKNVWEEALTTSKNSKNLYETKKVSFDRLEKKYQDAQKYINDHSTLLVTMADLKAAIEKNKTKLEELKKEINEYKKLEQAFEKHKEAEEKLAQEAKNVIFLEGQYHIAKGYFLQNQAGLLAQNLKENTPCPVCGSLEHPSLCQSVFKEYTEERMNQSEKLYNQEKNQYSSNKATFESETKALEEQKDRLKESFESIFNREFVFDSFLKTSDIILSELLEERNVHSKNELELEKAYKLYEQNRIFLKNTRLQEEKEILDNVQKTYQENANKEIEAKASYDSLYEPIKNYNKESLHALKVEKEEEKNKLQKKILSYQENAQTYEKQKEAIISSIETLKNGLPTLELNKKNSCLELAKVEEKYGIKALTAKGYLLSEENFLTMTETLKAYETSVAENNGILQNAIQNGYDKLTLSETNEIKTALIENQNAINGLDESIGNLRTLDHETKIIVERIQKSYRIYQEKSKDYIPYKELSETFNGEISGKQRIPFETFYQVQFFRQILELASRRFSKMTDGKYEIVYKETDIKGAAKAGLDMEVLDNYNGTRRNIGTLSGGESFMASLALALSMSDIIQIQSGGISLDSMFIDEGFGTLDSDVLRNAIVEISKLSVNGKTIGLISHVDELKNQIPTQLRVEKKENGSIITKVNI